MQGQRGADGSLPAQDMCDSVTSGDLLLWQARLQGQQSPEAVWVCPGSEPALPASGPAPPGSASACGAGEPGSAVLEMLDLLLGSAGGHER